MFTKNDQIDMMAELFIDKQCDGPKEYILDPIVEEGRLKAVLNATTTQEMEAALFALIRLYRSRNTGNQGKYTADARQDLIRIIEENGQGVVAKAFIGEGAYCEGIRDYESAADFYVACVRVPKTDKMMIYLSLNNLGFCLNYLRRFAEAEKFIRQAIAVSPEKYNAWKNLGVSLEWQGQYEEAAECYLKAVQLGRGEPRSQMHLYRILRRHPTLRKIECFS